MNARRRPHPPARGRRSLSDPQPGSDAGLDHSRRELDDAPHGGGATEIPPEAESGFAPSATLADQFAHVTHWVFDLDNTLYPAACNLFGQIDVRMTDFVADKLGLERDIARTLQKRYYVEYGTTLSGLMKEHAVDADTFMDYVHDIDLSVVAPNAELAKTIDALPGEKHIFTNGSVRHAENVCRRLGIDHLFEGVFDIAAADYTPKPHRETYDRFIRRHDVDPAQAAMFEDLPQNLAPAFEMGMLTVLVGSDAPWLENEPADKRPARADETHDHVDHVTDDLTHFLNQASPARRETKNER